MFQGGDSNNPQKTMGYIDIDNSLKYNVVPYLIMQKKRKVIDSSNVEFLLSLRGCVV
jgi:hypothetical protein